MCRLTPQKRGAKRSDGLTGCADAAHGGPVRKPDACRPLADTIAIAALSGGQSPTLVVRWSE